MPVPSVVCMGVDPGSTSTGQGRARWAPFVVAVVTAAGAWWALLGWDTEKTRGADGYPHGPYEAWQIVSLIAVLALLAVWLGHRGSVSGGAGAAAVTLAICFGVSAELDPGGDGLWPVGATRQRARPGPRPVR